MALRVGLIGLGIMGSAYAAHLIDAGFVTSAFDIDAAALERFRKRGGTAASSPREVAANSDVIIVALASVKAI